MTIVLEGERGRNAVDQKRRAHSAESRAMETVGHEVFEGTLDVETLSQAATAALLTLRCWAARRVCQQDLLGV